jgi:hypothetical protein
MLKFFSELFSNRPPVTPSPSEVIVVSQSEFFRLNNSFKAKPASQTSTAFFNESKMLSPKVDANPANIESLFKKKNQ